MSSGSARAGASSAAAGGAHTAFEWTGRDRLLDALGVPHCFGSLGAAEPAGVRRPVQVHGTGALRAARDSSEMLGEGDAVVSSEAGLWVGVVTADCVPILAATADGRAVVAIHAGWRGLAAGVVGAGIEALRALWNERFLATSAPRSDEPRMVAAIGPHAGSCCYEVDEPVLGALCAGFGDARVAEASVWTRSGHARIDLAALVSVDLVRAGVRREWIGTDAAQCSIGHPERFHSFRRDASRAGRMLHAIAVPAPTDA